MLAEGAGPPALLGCSSATTSLGHSACLEKAAFAADGYGQEDERHPQPTGPRTEGDEDFKKSLNEKV